jgi:hypothetical protein
VLLLGNVLCIYDDPGVHSGSSTRPREVLITSLSDPSGSDALLSGQLVRRSSNVYLFLFCFIIFSGSDYFTTFPSRFLSYSMIKGYYIFTLCWPVCSLQPIYVNYCESSICHTYLINQWGDLLFYFKRSFILVGEFPSFASFIRGVVYVHKSPLLNCLASSGDRSIA